MDMHFEGVIFQTHAAELRRRIARPHPPYAVLDVRPREAWARGHIPGAISVSPDQLSRLPAGTTPTTELFVVGAGPGDPGVRAASMALRAAGAHRRVELSGGMSEWSALGYPVETGGGGEAEAA